MDLYHCVLQDQRARLESPAKVFAKLKAKVQKESVYGRNGGVTSKEDGAEFHSPRKRTKSTWMTDEHKEHQPFGSFPNEMQPLTLSPIASPPKNSGYKVRNGRSFLESTAVSRPLVPPLDKGQMPEGSLQLRGSVPSRTVVNRRAVENECGTNGHAPFYKPVSPGSVFSPMRKRLRKRKWEQQEINNLGSSAHWVRSGGIDEPQHRKASDFTVDNSHNNTGMEDLCNCRGFPVFQLEMIHDHLGPPQRSTAEKRCREGFPKSPAKIFASMKARESKRKMEHGPEVSCSMKNLFRDAQNVVPLTAKKTESADSQSEGNYSEDAPTSAVPLVLQEDLIVFKSPQVSIPKKHDRVVLKHNKWPKQIKFPVESVIYLKKWFLRKRDKGLFVDGIHGEDNIQWHSNIIVDRISNSVLKTVSGRVYVLVGNMKMDYASGFPKWLLKKFAKGFPPNWKQLYEKFLLEARNTQSNIRTGRNSERKTQSSTTNASTSKQCKQTPLKTAESCPPNSSFCSRVSRSGRTIKPPLEYWKGGRVVLDADMNVHVFECYETTICVEANTTVSARPSQKPVHVFPQCSKGSKQIDTTCDEEESVPLRKVKPPLLKCNRRSVKPNKKPCETLEPPVEKLIRTEESSRRKTKSRQKSPATVDTVPQKQSKPAMSKKTSDTADRCSVREKRGKLKATNSPESDTAHDKTLQNKSSGDAFSLENKRVPCKKGRKVQSKSRPDVSSLTQSSEDSGKRQRKRISRMMNNNKGQAKKKPSKCTKTSPSAEPLPESSKSSKKGNTQEDDEDEWTEAELRKLQEAVIYYPKHMPGYWAEIARVVETRSAKECYNKHTSQGTSKAPIKAAKKVKKQKMSAVKAPVTDNPVISAKVGTLKRKQQVRQFLENMPREDVEDAFSSAYMQSQRFEIPSLCPSDNENFTVSDLEPLSPKSLCFPEVKTPQCLHITPAMMGSPNRDCDDKYVYQLQKRMKKNQFNVCKLSLPAKNFTPTRLAKQPMRRCSNTGNNSFVVWEMFSGNNAAPSDSGEEEDFYFSDDD